MRVLPFEVSFAPYARPLCKPVRLLRCVVRGPNASDFQIHTDTGPCDRCGALQFALRLRALRLLRGI